MREGSPQVYRAVRFVVLAVVGGAVGFLVGRLLFPAVLELNVLFLALPILLMATLLVARAFRRGRSGT